MNENYCYINGEIKAYKECTLHISDLQFQRGYGVFDFFRSRSGKILWMDDYLDRLFSSALKANIELELSREDIHTIIYQLQEANKLDNSAFKIIVSGGYSETLDKIESPANVIILNIPWGGPPENQIASGINLISYSFQRHLPEIKTLNYFNTLFLRMHMKKYDAVDVLFHTDCFSEVSRSNIFFVKGKQIFTPERDILKGIVRKRILEMDQSIIQTSIPVEELYGFDEVFLSSTSREITPVVNIDGKNIGNGKRGEVTREMQEAFKEKWM